MHENSNHFKRLELREIAEMIRENPEKDKVFNLRLKYQFYKPPEPKLERTVYMSADQFIRGQVPETFFMQNRLNVHKII